MSHPLQVIDPDTASEVSNNEDCRIINDIVFDIDSLSERLSKMDRALKEYEGEEEKKDAKVRTYPCIASIRLTLHKIQLLKAQKSILKKDVESYKNLNAELNVKVIKFVLFSSWFNSLMHYS